MRNWGVELLLVIAIVLVTVFIVGGQDADDEEEYYSGMSKMTCANCANIKDLRIM